MRESPRDRWLRSFAARVGQDSGRSAPCVQPNTPDGHHRENVRSGRDVLPRSVQFSVATNVRFSVAIDTEVRERPADPCVPPLGILDRHPDHERGHVTSRHRPASTAAGAAGVCLGDQSPVPAENRVRRDDAGDLHPDAPSELLAAHGESTAWGIGQAKRPRAQVLPEDPILLPEIRDQIVLVAGHPASET